MIIHVARGYFTSRRAIILLPGIKPIPSKLSKGLCCEKGWSSTCKFIKSTETHLRTTKHLAFHQVDIALHPGHVLKRKAAQVLPQNRNSFKSNFFGSHCTWLDGAVEILLSEHHSVSKDSSPQSAEVVP